MTMPRPVKKPICSTTRCRLSPTGWPALPPVCHSELSRAPSVNQAPLSAASHAPKMATGRLAVPPRIRPPTTVPAAGRISSHRRPVV